MIEHESDAGQLADRLDAALPPHQHTINDLNGDERVNAAARLAAAPPPELSPEAMARMQQRVLEAARQQRAQQRIIHFHMPLALRWAAVFLLVFLGMSATIPAAAGSLPGDVLYPVKRGYESVERLLAVSPDARAEVYLTQAGRRLDEAQGLLARNQFDVQLLHEAQTGIAEAAQNFAATSPDVQAQIEVRAAQLARSAADVAQAAAAAGLVAPDEIGDLLPAPTAAPTDAPLPTDMPAPTTSPTDLPTNTPPATQTAVPTVTPPSTASPTPDTVLPTAESGTVIAGSAVNVRKGPGTEFEIIAVLQPGTIVQIIGKSEAGDWEHIRLPDNRAGWISAALIGNDAAAAQPGNPNQVGGGRNNQNCDHPGNYCNAPGQEKNNIPGNNGSQPGQGGNPGNGPPENHPGGGNPSDKPPKDKDK